MDHKSVRISNLVLFLICKNEVVGSVMEKRGYCKLCNYIIALHERTPERTMSAMIVFFFFYEREKEKEKGREIERERDTTLNSMTIPHGRQRSVIP